MKKKNKDWIAFWNYKDISTIQWGIRPLNKSWGISHKTGEKLNRKGIHSILYLANYPLKYLKQIFGKIGEEFNLHSHEIDFSRISEKYVPATTSIEKSQILMCDYTIEKFPIVLLEHIEEVSCRLRRQNKLAQTVHFSVGYSKSYSGGFRKIHTLIHPTNLTMDIYNICTYFLHQQYT